MTEQSPQTAEIQKYYKLLTTLIITGFYLASCTTDQDSPDSPDAVLTNNSPTSSEVFDTAAIVPTDNPPAVEVTNDDSSQANIQETVEATETQVAEQEETAAEQVETDLSSGNYNQAVISTEQALANGEFDSLKEALLELWLPMLRDQTLYSDVVFERLSPNFVGLEVNMQGQVVITDADGNILVEKTVPGTSNLDWAIPISKLAYGLDAEEVEDVMKWMTDLMGFGEDIKVGDNTSLYHFYAVLDDVVQLEIPYQLPDGKIVTTLARIYYLDANGVQQMIYIPYFTYDPEELILHSIGTGITKVDSKDQFITWIDGWSAAAKDKNMGPMTISGSSRVEYGQIFIIGFDMGANPLLDASAKEFFENTVVSFHTQSSLDGFAKTGDPSFLPQILEEGSLLVPLMDN